MTCVGKSGNTTGYTVAGDNQAGHKKPFESLARAQS